MTTGASSTSHPDRPAVELESLRILVVTVAAHGLGGMQRHTHDLVRGLTAAGHDVEVFCPRADELEPDLYGARWTLLDTPGRSRDWPRLILAAYRAAMTRGALDVIHSESSSARPLVKARVPTPITTKYHGNYIGLARAHVQRALARPRSIPRELRRLAWLTRAHVQHGAWAFRDCESMVPSHQQLRDSARSTLTPLDRFHVVPNGVDVSFFRPGDRVAARRKLEMTNGVALATVGRFSHEKGFDVALQMFARVAAEYPEASLVMVGDGEERAALEQLARSLGVETRTSFVGAQPLPRVVDYLVASDVFLFPTRREEAGPLVVPEAIACGLPVVASRIGGVSEVLEPPGEKPVGLLVRPGSVDDLESAVRTLLGDPALRASLGEAARERAVREYALETMVARTIAVYRTAIARSTL